LVILAGTVTPQLLQRKVSGYRNVPNVIGFSVQSTPQKTIQELAAAGGFFDPLLSVTTVGELQKAGQSAWGEYQDYLRTGTSLSTALSSPHVGSPTLRPKR
jgi:hypothetical protein